MTDKTELEKHVDKMLADIIFNGCKIPSAILKAQFNTTILLAKLEQSQEHAKSMFTRPEVIGDMIHEPENIKPEDMVKGEWYSVKYDLFDWLVKFDCIKLDSLNVIKAYSYRSDSISDYVGPLTFLQQNINLSIRKATREEVLKYFPNEFNQPNEINEQN